MGRRTVQVLFLFSALVLLFFILRQPKQEPNQKPNSEPESQTRTPETVDDEDRLGSPNPDQTTAMDADEVFYGYCPDANRPNRPMARPSLAELLNKQPFGLMDQQEQRELGPVFQKALQRAQAALSQKKAGQALQVAREVWNQTQHTLGAVLVAYIATRIGDKKNARSALVAAHEELPDQRNIALALALNLRHTEHIRQASQALDVYLQSAPKDISMHQLQARLKLQWDLHKDHRRYTHAGITLLVTPTVKTSQAEALLLRVHNALREAADLTQTKPRPELNVVVYADRSELLAATCVPSWAGGVYDGTLRLHALLLEKPLLLEKTVRHESLHAQLHYHVKNIPQWFNEGLAQYLAKEKSPAHIRSYRRMIKHQTYIPFSAMDDTFGIFHDPQDAKLAYHQSLAMIELLIEVGSRTAIARSVEYLRQNKDIRQMMPAAVGISLTGDDLLRFLQRTLKHD